MSIKTLLVDDDKSLLSEGKKFLEKINEEIEVLTISSEETALEMIDEEDPDVIVSEYKMHDIDEIEFLERLREEKGSDIPFIIFTSKGREKSALKALNLGADKYVEKGDDLESQYERLADAIAQEYEERVSRAKKSERELCENCEELQKYEKMFNETPLGAFHYDGKGIITECNDRFVEIIGSSREDLLGLDMLNDLENDELVEEVRSSLEEGRGYYEGEYTSVTGKKTIEVRVFLRGIEDEDGRIKSGMGLLEDNTQRKEYEQELKRKERYLDHTPTFITVIDEDGEVKYHSYPSDEETGVESSEIVGMDAMEYAHPDDEEEVQKMFSDVLKNPGDEFVTELRVESEDGWRWLEIRAVNYLDDPDINGIVVTSQDIDDRKEMEKELKESEKRFRSLFESSMDALVVLTPPEWKFTSANPAAVEMFRAEDKDELHSKSPWEFSPEKQPDGQLSKEKAKKMIDRAVSEGEASFEWRHKRLDGEEFPAKVNLSRVEIGDEPFLQATIRDITEMKEKEEKLRKERKKFSDMFNNVNDAIYLHDVNEEFLPGKFIEVNDTATEMFRYSREEFLEMSPMELSAEENIEEVSRMMKELVDKGDIQFEMTLQAKDGTEMPVEIHSHVIESEVETRIISVVRDITERKEAEEELKKSEQKFRTIIDNSADAIFLTDQEGNYTYANEAATELLGYSKEEITEMNIVDILPDEDVEEELENFGKISEEEKVLTELTLLDRDGKEIPAELNAVLLPNGKIYGSVRDITERKEAEEELKKSEEKFRTVIENSADAIYLTDQEGDFLYANEAATDLLGYTKEELLDMNMTEPAKNPERLFELFEKLFEEDRVSAEAKYVKKDGTEITVDINAVLLPDGRIYGSSRDVTERKEMEEKLRESEKKFRTIIEGSADAIFLTDQEGNYTYANEAASDLLGYSREEFTEMNIADLAKEEKMEEHRRLFEKLLKEEKIHTEISFVKKDGTEVPVDINAVMLPTGEIYGSCRDMTERREMEEKLKKSEKKFRTIIEGSADAIFLTDQEGNYTYANEAASDLLGYSREEITEMNLADIAPEERVEEYQKIFQKIVEEEKIHTEMALVDKDGKAIPVDLNAVLLPNGRIYGSVRDISDRKEAENELKKKEEKYRNIFEQFQDLYYKADLDGNIKELSPSVRPLSGYTRDELIGEPVSKVYSDPEEREELLNELLENGEVKGRELKLEKKSGEIAIVSVNSQLIKDENGEVKGVEGTIRDITEKKKAEEAIKKEKRRYETLFQENPESVVEVDEDHKIVRVNEQFQKVFGYKEEEIIGEELDDLLVPEDKMEDAKELNKKSKEEGYFEHETVRLTKNGDKIDVSITARPIEYEGKTHIIGVYSDITERKEAEEREKFLHSLLRHDIKNKAQAVQGYLQLLMEGKEELSKDSQEMVEGALTANKEGVDLIQKVKLLLTAQEEEVRPVEIISTIKNSVESNEKRAEIEGIELSVEYPSSKCEVQGGSLLGEIFNNIIENSINHSEGSKINISAEEKDGEVLCMIEDDGKGIPDDKKETIFEKGYTTDEERGTGLGLFLVNNLLKSYDGSIEVGDSEMGGARFTVYLRKV